MSQRRHARELTTTSFALLGLLASKPSGWSAYELAKQMRRSMHYIWPRAERNLYDEVKLLAERGFAKTRDEHTGRRPRTVYSITPAGRRELRAWLGQPSLPVAIESEALVRVFFAEHGSRDDLLGAIRSVREEAEATEHEVANLVAGYEVDGGPFPERLHVTALMARLLFNQREALRRWAEWAEAEVLTWETTMLHDGARIPPGVFTEIITWASQRQRSLPDAETRSPPTTSDGAAPV